MSTTPTDPHSQQRSLRLWPGIVLVALLGLLRFGLPMVNPDWAIYGVLGALLCGFAVLLWWLLASRAPWRERFGAIGLIVLALFVTRWFLHESVRGAGMGFLFFIYAIPLLTVALVVWAVLSRSWSVAKRWLTMLGLLVVASGLWLLVRTDGITGGGGSDFAWRWTPTAEEELLASSYGAELAQTAAATASAGSAGSAGSADLTDSADSLDQGESATPATPADSSMLSEAAQAETPSDESAMVVAEQAGGDAVDANDVEPNETVLASSADQSASHVMAASEPDVAIEQPVAEAEWPGFRGPNRDSVLRGQDIATDWAASPPVELWRRRVGPGWSSFAVRGDLFFTQEQRGEEEIVGCYRVSTGEPVWRHADPVRFWESNAGAGPRGTPTLHGGRVYAFGATGLLNALSAEDGGLIWSRDVAADTEEEVPMWGFSSSPLVIDDVVIVGASGRLAGYGRDTGELRWLGPVEGTGYSSPHLVTIDGVEQVLFMSGAGLTSVQPADGSILWSHPWDGYPIVQPAITENGDLLISADQASGTRRLTVARHDGDWSLEERWTSIRLKPYFNDFVVHKGHAYGFDGRILASIDLEDGERQWKGGRYGHGQMILLADQDLLLVLSEKGELALVDARPSGFEERARFPAIEGKTWNHPVLVGDVLLVRNDREMAAFRLARSGR